MENAVLIVEDKEINRMILASILEDTYNVVEAENGIEALKIMNDPTIKLSAIITDLIMPEMDGYKLLEIYRASPEFQNIPVIVSTGETDAVSEVKCLEYGAWDFIKKPYNAQIIRFRVKNVIERSEFHLLKELRYREQFDLLTGIYKKNMFEQQTQKMFEKYPDTDFMMLHVDIYKFQTYNSVFGIKEGDRLLCYIAGEISRMAQKQNPMTYCRIEADAFCMCLKAAEKTELQEKLDAFRTKLRNFKEDYDLLPNLGVYYIEDKTIPVSRMIDRAKLASKECKGSYIQNYFIYTDEIGQGILQEQAVVNSMEPAMKEGQFVLYLQPKYGLETCSLRGAEVLVRWKDPKKGIISPGIFIPIFEKNGLVMKLDYYIWEHSCRLIRKWLDEGRKPFPISVNISRISMYNPKIVEEIHELVLKYDIPPELFQLELTESAYTTNPNAIKEAMSRLREYGFTILMDDFGSGYSSLNVLKDIEVDMLKLDMKFMSAGDNKKRSESIIENVVRLAKDLDLPVIVEGVEEKEQVDFLTSIGCEYVQGYYFARPMPVEDYEALAWGDQAEQEV